MNNDRQKVIKAIPKAIVCSGCEIPLRKYFAAKAMQELLHDYLSHEGDVDNYTAESISKEAYIVADAMLRMGRMSHSE